MTSRKSFPLRIDPKLFDELEAWARQELRSVNGQIEYLLKDAIAKRRSEARLSGPRRGSRSESTRPSD